MARVSVTSFAHFFFLRSMVNKIIFHPAGVFPCWRILLGRPCWRSCVADPPHTSQICNLVAPWHAISHAWNLRAVRWFRANVISAQVKKIRTWISLPSLQIFLPNAGRGDRSWRYRLRGKRFQHILPRDAHNKFGTVNWTRLAGTNLLGQFMFPRPLFHVNVASTSSDRCCRLYSFWCI